MTDEKTVPPPPEVNTNTEIKVKIEPPTHHAKPPQPEKLAKAFLTVLQWLLIFAVITGLYYAGRLASIKLPTLHLTAWQIVLTSFCFAFTWVYIFRWGSVKPFNCVTCLSGWFALIIGYWSHGYWGFAYMPLAMTFAAIYSEIRLRWL